MSNETKNDQTIASAYSTMEGAVEKVEKLATDLRRTLREQGTTVAAAAEEAGAKAKANRIEAQQAALVDRVHAMNEQYHKAGDVRLRSPVAVAREVSKRFNGVAVSVQYVGGEPTTVRFAVASTDAEQRVRNDYVRSDQEIVSLIADASEVVAFARTYDAFARELADAQEARRKAEEELNRLRREDANAGPYRYMMIPPWMRGPFGP